MTITTPHYRTGMTLGDIKATGKQTESTLLREALESNGWNQCRTAAALGCLLNTLRRAIWKHDDLTALLKQHGLPQGHPKTAKK